MRAKFYIKAGNEPVTFSICFQTNNAIVNTGTVTIDCSLNEIKIEPGRIKLGTSFINNVPEHQAAALKKFLG
jgi:hypothetical protein